LGGSPVTAADVPALARSRFRPRGWRGGQLAIKRAIDLGGATVGLVVLAPVLIWVALLLTITQGRPIFFRQQRPGLGGRPFAILKFRTMRPPRPGEVWYLTDDERITPLGHVLRATSLDELPELWNVLRGEMSLVGPRPLLMEYLSEYTPEEARRHDVRPGITGWAAINGRNVLGFRERLALDVWYVDHWSLGLDLRILLRTPGRVLRRQDATITEDLALGFPLPPAPQTEAITELAPGASSRPAPGSGPTSGSTTRRAATSAPPPGP
jgi:sugar transferase EpsL